MKNITYSDGTLSREWEDEPMKQDNKLKTIEDALRRIIKWHGEFPSTGKVWECSGAPMSYGVCYGSNGERDYMRSVANQALTDLKALQKTHVLVPREPTEEQWGGLARALMMARDLRCNKADEIRRHLERGGHNIPGWLDEELEGEKHMAKGDMCVIIYKAMIAEAQE